MHTFHHANGRRTATIIGAAALLLAGCAASVPLAKPPSDLDLIGSAHPTAGLRIRLGLGDRRVQELPAPYEWDTARFTLSNSTLLTADRQQSIASSSFNIGAMSAVTETVLFSNVRAGAYALYASTYLGSVRSALGYTPSLSLAAGATTPANVTLKRLPVWKDATMVNTAGVSGTNADPSSPATALLNGPQGVAFGSDGTLYVVDAGNTRIRKVNPARTTVETVVANTAAAGIVAPRSLVCAKAIDSGQDALFVADGQSNKIYCVRNMAGAATVEQVIVTSGKPQALYFDQAGMRLFAALDDNSVVEYANPPLTSGILTMRTIIGTSSVTVNQPRGLALSGDASTLYVADSGNRRVLGVSMTTFAGTTVAGDGQALSQGDGSLATRASFLAPAALAFDADRNLLYVLDEGAKLVRAVAPSNGLIATVYGGAASGGGGYAQQATLSNPTAMALYNGGLYAADGNLIRYTP